MPAAAVPLISSGVGALTSIFGKKSANQATQMSPAEQQAQTGQLGAADTQGAMGGKLFAQGMPQTQQAGSYFSSLAGGNRAQMTQALAPDIQNINDVYGGTASALSRFTRGPERSVQMGEAERERSGKIASLFSSGRFGANQQLAQMGAQSTGQAGGLFSAASAGYGNVGQRGMQNRYLGEGVQRQAGQDTGNALFGILQSYQKYQQGRGGGGGGGGDVGPTPWGGSLS